MCLTHGSLQLLFLLANHVAKHTATMYVNIMFNTLFLSVEEYFFLAHIYVCVFKIGFHRNSLVFHFQLKAV